MKKIFILAFVSLSFSSVSYAELTSCQKLVESKTQRLLRNYTEAVRVPARDPLEQVQRLDRTEQRLRTFIDGEWAKKCDGATAFLSNIRSGPLADANSDALSQTLMRCEQRLTSILQPFEQAQIDALQKRNGEQLVKSADTAEQRITSDLFLARCPGYSARLSEKLDGPIQQARNLGISMPEIESLDHYFPGIVRTMTLVSTANEKNDRPSPPYLTTEQGRTTFNSALSKCKKSAKTMLNNGVSGDAKWTIKGSETSLLGLAEFCTSIAQKLDELGKKASTLNAIFDKKNRQNWESINLKTKVMKGVYKENQRQIPIITTSSKGSIWQYRFLVDRDDFHQCRSYYFDKTGKRLRDLRVARCD